MGQPVVSFLQGGHVYSSPWLGGPRFASYYHSVAADCWGVGWYLFQDAHVHISYQTLLYFLLPVEWYSVRFDMAGEGGLRLDSELERGSRHAGELLVGTVVEC